MFILYIIRKHFGIVDMKKGAFCIFVLAVIYTFWSSTIIFKTHSIRKTQLGRTQLKMNFIYERLNEVIDEKEALKYKPCTDENNAANGLNSVLKLDSPNKTYTIGEKIFVKAYLFDGFGNKKSIGGDVIRAKIWNKQNNLSAPGAVFDHQNGQYTLIFECLWSGTSYISATIAYNREAVTAIYRLLTEGLALYYIEAKYKAQDLEDEVLCFPDKSRLLAFTYYTDVCNFTNINSGMPWFCGKPRGDKLTCNDWKFLRQKWPYFPPQLTSCEKGLLYNRLHQPIRSVVKVSINGFPLRNKVLNRGEIHCSKYNTTKLWFLKHTTGYFQNKRWHLTHCKGFVPNNSSDCLKHKHIYLLGDSTVRQWYDVFTQRYQCEEKTYKKWNKSMECYVKSLNFTVTFKRHSLPYYPGVYWMNPEMVRVSIQKVMESIPSHESAIVLIHVFLHMRIMHPRYFKSKIRRIRSTVETLLKRNKLVKIFIKMPHTFLESFRECNDFFAYTYIQIIHETFTGLYDKIIVLDNKDASNAVDSDYMHPYLYIVEAMVDQMLGYICYN